MWRGNQLHATNVEKYKSIVWDRWLLTKRTYIFIEPDISRRIGGCPSALLLVGATT